MQYASNTKEINELGDQWWRLNNLYYILDAKMRRVLFVPNEAQQFLYHNVWYLNIILKARQLGFSTFIDIWALDTAFWNNNQRVVIIAQDKIAAENLFEEKIKYPYDQLSEQVKALNPRVRSNARELKFANNSSIRVVTSARSGTVNFLHISEFGKICAKYPEKAREVVTGTLNTVAPGEIVFIESTAEGREGPFFEMTDRAIKLHAAAKKLGEMDYKFHFFPWYEEPRYKAEPDNVIISPKEHDYFDLIEHEENVTITNEQRAWYCIKKIEQGEDMKREYPSTPKEAFEQSIMGAYFKDDMLKARSEGRLRRVPYEPRLPVYTFWDIGRDTTAIWFMQHNRINKEYRFIRYMAGMNRSLQYYVKEMYKLGYVFETHYLPHDADITSIDNPDETTRADVLRALGMRVEVVPRVKLKGNAIQAVRDRISDCWFDEELCADGIKCLDHYRAEWDDKLGTFKRDTPLHDWASHGSDAFQQFAMGFKDDIRYNEQELMPEEVNDY